MNDEMRIYPAFSDCAEAIVFCINNYYCPYFAVMLLSVIEHASPSREYDILIFHRDITTENQRIIIDMGKGKEHISIRFANVSSLISDYSLYIGGKEDFSVDTYLRLLIPDVMDSVYRKALYLDADMMALADVGELLNTDLDGFLLASSRDLYGLAEYYDPASKRKAYRDEILQLEKPDDYFIAGMLVFNLEVFRRHYTSELLLKMASSKKWLQHDQDVLNLICNGGKAKLLHAQWDVLFIPPIKAKSLPKQYQIELDESYASPKIIHFGGNDKPWKTRGNPWDDLFWDTAAKTPFYKAIIYRILDETNTKYKYALERVKKSASYKTGRVITWLPRKMLGRIRKR